MYILFYKYIYVKHLDVTMSKMITMCIINVRNTKKRSIFSTTDRKLTFSVKPKPSYASNPVGFGNDGYNEGPKSSFC